ncbi:MAG: hypothetical protein AB7I04_19495 [Pseudomonadales bacterium]
MNWEAVGAVGEVLGAIGVIVTLAYLAVQIRQSTHAQRTETYGRALDRVTTLQGRLAENSDLASILLRGVPDNRQLTATERVQFTWIFYEMFSGFEFMLYQAERDALPQEVWQRWADTIRWWMSFPGVRQWWAAHPAPFTADFTKFVNDQLDTAPADEAAATRWVSYLREGRRSELP